MNERILRVAHGSLHLIIHDALIFEFTRSIIPLLELEAVSLLAKIKWVESREERHLQVHGQQIVEVLLVCRRKGVHREVTPRPRIHVGVQTSLDHVEERISDWVFSGSASS